jgi:hypothetical protein
MSGSDFPLLLAGAIGGVVFFSFALVGFDITHAEGVAVNSADLSTLTAGFGGAVLGGFISWLLARQSSREVAKKDAEARVTEEKAIVLRTLLKMIQISNYLHTLHVFFEKSINQSNAIKLWMRIIPQTQNEADLPQFEANDFVPFIEMGQAEIVNRSMLLSSRANSLSAGFNQYVELRLAWQEWSARYTEGNPDGTMSSAFSGRQQNVAQSKAIVMESLVQSIWKHLQVDRNDANALCRDISDIAVSRFKDSGPFVSLELGPDTSHELPEG